MKGNTWSDQKRGSKVGGVGAWQRYMSDMGIFFVRIVETDGTKELRSVQNAESCIPLQYIL